MIKSSIEMLINTYREELETGIYNFDIIKREIINNLAIDPTELLTDKNGKNKEKINVDELIENITDVVLNNIENEYKEAKMNMKK